MFNVSDKVFYLDYDTIYEVTIESIECYGFGRSVHKVRLDRILDHEENFGGSVCLADVDSLFVTSDEAKNELEKRKKIALDKCLHEIKTVEDLLKFPLHHSLKDSIYDSERVAYIQKVKELLNCDISE